MNAGVSAEVEADPTVLGRDDRPEQAQHLHLLDQRVRVAVVELACLRGGNDLLRDEAPDFGQHHPPDIVWDDLLIGC